MEAQAFAMLRWGFSRLGCFFSATGTVLRAFGITQVEGTSRRMWSYARESNPHLWNTKPLFYR